MKKIDKLIFKAFIGPFFLTFFIAIFIFLIQIILKYIPDLVGKGLGAEVFSELLLYFSINVTPTALPLAILLSSLMAYGNLGEHFELTAIKSAGISLVRTLIPIFIFSIFLCFLAFYINNDVVPKANLKAFSLLYDVRQKKPTFDFKEGSFYNGLPGYSIKVNKKFEDGKTMKEIMIYNHTGGRGNVEITMADSALMYMILNDKYLVMELFRGELYSEMEDLNPANQQFVRNKFDKSKFVFSMESFNLQRTQEELFSSHKIMRNVSELKKDVDSLRGTRDSMARITYMSVKPFYSYSFRIDSTTKGQDVPRIKDAIKDTVRKKNILQYATNTARSVKSYFSSQKDRAEFLRKEANSFEIEWYKKFTLSFACLVMFLIGAPLGSIMKKGGLGVPVIISIIFFVSYYILSSIAEKWTKEGLLSSGIGMWSTNMIFLPIGLFFLRQAKNDSRILETDYFAVVLDKIKSKFKRKDKL